MEEPNAEDYSKKVLSFLSKRAPNFRCPACQHDEFSLVPGFHIHNIQKRRQGIELGSGAVAVTVVCRYCGLMYDFSTKVIDGYGKKKSN